MKVQEVILKRARFTDVRFTRKEIDGIRRKEFFEGCIVIDGDRRVRFFDNVDVDPELDKGPFYFDYYSRVERNGKYNLIDRWGIILNDKEWFDDLFKLSGKYALAEVERDKRFNWMDSNGDLVSPKLWFRYVSVFDEKGFARVWTDDYEELYIKNDGILYDSNKKKLPDNQQVNLKKNK